MMEKKGNLITIMVASAFLLLIIVILVIVNNRFGDINYVINETNGNQSLANPASVYCIENGGNLSIRTDIDGSQYGICVLADRECEEWAYLRGDCGPAKNASECQTDADCVPASCCHASSCMPASQAKACNLFCTQECVPGTLDCGQGRCACVNNKCSINLTGVNGKRSLG